MWTQGRQRPFSGSGYTHWSFSSSRMWRLEKGREEEETISLPSPSREIRLCTHRMSLIYVPVGVSPSFGTTRMCGERHASR